MVDSVAPSGEPENKTLALSAPLQYRRAQLNVTNLSYTPFVSQHTIPDFTYV